MEKQLRVRSISPALCFNRELLSSYFYLITCCLCCLIKGKYFHLLKVYGQVQEPLIIPLLQGREGRGKRSCDTASHKFNFNE